MDRIKVLFVDDDVALGNIVTLALESSGYEVHYQTSLVGVKTVAKEMQPDIIVLDLEIGAKNDYSFSQICYPKCSNSEEPHLRKLYLEALEK